MNGHEQKRRGLFYRRAVASAFKLGRKMRKVVERKSAGLAVKSRAQLSDELRESQAELKLAAKLIETLHAEIADRKRAQIAVAQLLESERERNKDLFQQGVDQAFRIHDLERQLRELRECTRV